MEKSQLEQIINIGQMYNKTHNPFKFELMFLIPFELKIPLTQLLKTKRDNVDLDKKTLKTKYKTYKLTDKIVELLKKYFGIEKEDNNFLNTTKRQISWTIKRTGTKSGLRLRYTDLTGD